MSQKTRMSRTSELGEEAALYFHDPSAASPRVSDRGTLLLDVAQRVLDRLQELEAKYAEQGRSLADLGSAEDLAKRMTAAVPAPSPWAEIGPFYGTTSVSRLLGGISRQAISDRRKRGTVLGLKTADGAWVYPTFQFDDHHAVLEGLPEVWKILRASGADEWTLASWLTSSLATLEQHSPIDWLRLGENREALLTAARDAARRFAQ